MGAFPRLGALSALSLFSIIACLMAFGCRSTKLGFRERVLIFQHSSSRDPGSNYFNHAPTLERLPDGRLVAAWFGGQEEGTADNHILLCRSSDEGATWSRPSVVFDPPGDANARGTLLFYHAGHLWMILSIAGPGAGDGVAWINLYLTSSTDGGKSWSAPQRIDTGKDRTYAPLHKPVILTDGRVAFGFYWRYFNDSQTHVGILIANHSLSAWISEGDVFLARQRTLEPILTKEADGRLFLFMRTDLDHLYSSTSTDEGATWTTPSPLPVPNPDSFSYLQRQEDGQYLVAWNNHADARDYLSLGLFSGPDLSKLQSTLVVRRRDKRAQRVSYPQVVVADRVLIIYSVLETDASGARFGDILFESLAKNWPQRTGSLNLNQEKTDVRDTLRSVAFSTRDQGWVVGANGRILHTTDGGQTWSSQTSGTDRDLQTVYFTSENSGLIFGDGVRLTTTDAGLTWSKADIKINVSALDFVDSQTGVAVAFGGEILRTTDGGVSFQQKYMCSCKALFDVSYSGNDIIWATGGDGNLLRSADRGASWHDIFVAPHEDLTGIAFDSSGRRGLVIGDHEVMLATSDGGASWQWRRSLLKESGPSTVPERLKGIIFTAQDEAIIVSDQATLWRSVDLLHFTRQQTQQLNSFTGIFASQNGVFITGWDGRMFRLNSEAAN